MSGRASRSTGGSGIVLSIAALVVLILSVIVLADAVFASSVSDQAMVEHVGAMELAVAESAVEEMAAQAHAGVNQRESPLFEAFRGGAGRGRREVALPVPPPAVTIGLLERSPAYRAHELKLTRHGVRVLYERPVTDLSYESYGTLEYTVTIRSNRRPYVTRVYTAWQDFKTALITTPRPFDQMLFCVRRPDRLLEGVDLHAKRVEDLRLRLESTIARIAASPGAGALRDQLARLRELLAGIPRFDRAATGRDDVHGFPPDMLAFALPGADGDRGAIDGDMADLAGATRPLWEAIDGAVEDVARSIDSPGVDVTRALAHLGAAQRAADKMREHQVRVRDWQRRFSEYTGDARQEMDSYFRYLERDAIRRKAFLTLSDRDPAGRELDVTRSFRRLLERLGRVSGVVWVDNPSRPLDLSGIAVHGKLVIGATGDVVMRDTSVGEASDRLTVIGYGRVTLEGSVSASVVSLGRVDVGNGGCRLTGNLIVDRPSRGDLARLSVQTDPRVAAGRGRSGSQADRDPAYVVVALAPRMVCRRADRARSPR